ncbi:hypothetical protein IFM89_006571 [Coptis chinensis]|uniref:Trehalose 6-phosphate phosphatase n=1 Tax=Coptis chinensis TaxID=261450 RepID=A0A835ILG7_9MAGN|nr:hypothetical protein IFM89_006571 [Coptis chinensis]
MYAVLFRQSHDEEWETCVPVAEFDWKQTVEPVMKLYTETTDGSTIETKESALVWHYQYADPDFGSYQAKELLDHLESVLANDPVSVKSGQHIVEVKPQADNSILEALEAIFPNGSALLVTGSMCYVPLSSVFSSPRFPNAHYVPPFCDLQLLSANILLCFTFFQLQFYPIVSARFDEGVVRGSVAERLLKTMRDKGMLPDFVLCIGDDRSDEDIFEVITTAAAGLIPRYLCSGVESDEG